MPTSAFITIKVEFDDDLSDNEIDEQISEADYNVTTEKPCTTEIIAVYYSREQLTSCS
jgi:hypothetical protein